MSERAGAIVVEQSNVNVNVLWGTLAGAFSVALWFGHRGAETVAGRIAVDAIAGGIVVVSVLSWISFRRHPARLEITSDTISLVHRGREPSTVLRGPGDLYLHYVRIGTRGVPQPHLRSTGSEGAIPLQLFRWKEVRGACLATGWHFTEPRMRRWRTR